MDTRCLFYSLLRGWWIIAILAIIGGCIGLYTVSGNSVYMYKANSTLYIMNRDKVLVVGKSLDLNDINVSRELVQDYSEIIKSHMVTSEAISRLKNANISKVTSEAISRTKNINISEDTLNSIVNVGIQTDSNILTISAIWSDPETAMAICNTMSRVFVEKMNTLTNSNIVGVLDEAGLPQYPLGTNDNKNIPLGILAGMAIGVSIIYVREMFDTTVRSVEDIEEGLELNIIGIIPVHSIK